MATTLAATGIHSGTGEDSGGVGTGPQGREAKTDDVMRILARTGKIPADLTTAEVISIIAPAMNKAGAQRVNDRATRAGRTSKFAPTATKLP